VPVITHTVRPSVTGEGDDMFCFIMRASPPPNSLPERHAAIAVDRPEIHVAAIGHVEKMWSLQTTGVEPDHRATPVSRRRSPPTTAGQVLLFAQPFSDGPRHWGQFSADGAAPVAQSKTMKACVST
jgi:hypothetical protein